MFCNSRGLLSARSGISCIARFKASNAVVAAERYSIGPSSAARDFRLAGNCLWLIYGCRGARAVAAVFRTPCYGSSRRRLPHVLCRQTLAEGASRVHFSCGHSHVLVSLFHSVIGSVLSRRGWRVDAGELH